MPLSSSPQNPDPQDPARPAGSGPISEPAGGSVSAGPSVPTYGASRVWTICFAVLTLELGGFLLVFPWMDSWHLNHFPALVPAFFEIWDDPYFRGAISGLGVVNLLISLAQFLYLVRSSRNS